MVEQPAVVSPVPDVVVDPPIAPVDVPSSNAPFALSTIESENLKIAASLSNRVYLFKQTDSFDPSFEEYFEPANQQDAAAVAVYPDRCFVALRGTKPFNTTEVDASEAFKTITVDYVKDLLANADNIVKQDIFNIGNTASCRVSNGYFESYERVREFIETKVLAECQGKSLYITGHR